MAELSIETDDTECIISNTEISIPEDLSTNENNDHGSTESLLEAVRKSDIVSVVDQNQLTTEKYNADSKTGQNVMQMEQQKVLSNGDANVT